MTSRTVYRLAWWPRTALLVGLLIVAPSIAPALGQLTDRDIEELQALGEKEGWTFTVGRNPATEVPLEQLCGLVVPENWWEEAFFDPCPPRRALPATFDWRALNGVTPVKNQGGCGSCWAFGTVGPLECNIKIKDGVTVDLSEQWLVSCNRDGWSCSGGWFAHNYHQWKTDTCGGYGAVLESSFPYVASNAPCNCPYPHPYRISGWAYVGNSSSIPPVANIKQAIMDYGPVSVAVYANSAMQAYTGGIFNGCVSATVNHAVVLVGWDDNQGGGVWFMRNSWGTGWGENGGYMRIPYNCSRIGYAACYVNYPGATYTLTTSVSGSGSITLNPPGGSYSSGTTVTVTANAAGGWHFDRWELDLSGSTNPTTILMNGNKSVRAVFARNVYTLTTSVTGSGSITLNPPGGSYLSGTTVQLTAQAGAGWQFDQWSGDLNGSANPASLLMNGNKSVTAAFAPSVCRGDANCDGVITWRDVDYFVAGLNGNEPGWQEKFAPGAPSCSFANCDVNGDGTVSWRDINPFVARMNTTCP